LTKKKKMKFDEVSDSEEQDIKAILRNWFNSSSSVVLIALILIPFMVLMFLIDQKVAKANSYLFDENSLSVKNEMPQWLLDYGLYEKIRLNNSRVKKSYLGKSYFNKNILSDLHAQLVKNPWIKEVHLTKIMPNKINANLIFRKPAVSFLVSKKVWYYLDNEIQLLPLKEVNGNEEIPVVRIRGIPFSKNELKRFKPGLKLKKIVLKKSMSLIDEVNARVELPSFLKEIRVSYLRKRTIPRFKLIFDNGLEVLWGEFLFTEEIDGFPGKQLTTQMKLDQLVKTLNKKPNALFCNVEYKN